MPGAFLIRRAVRRLAPKALILLYHRVSEPIFDPQLLCVSPDHFADHMHILKQLYHPLSLKELRQRRALNLWPDRSVVITFDDGYADNFTHARSILEKYDLPATIFVTSGYVGSSQEFWWDELERIFLSTANLPTHLELVIGEKEHSWNFDDNQNSSSTISSWNILEKDVPTQRQQAYMFLMKILRDLSPDARNSMLSELAAWVGINRDQGRLENLSVNADTLRVLPIDGLIEVGAHTVSHPVLSRLSLSSQQHEIVESKTNLEKILDRPIPTFAYPFGERKDYTLDTTRLVQEAGFTCACSNFTGFVSALTDPRQLPRFIVRDWDGDTFAKQMKDWFHA